MIGTVVENSLEDKGVLKHLKILKTWHDGDWTLHQVSVTEKQATQIASSLAHGPWYVHFWEPSKDEVLVIFKDKSFWIKSSDKTTWLDAISYGKGIGIPEEQLDFLTTD